MSSLSINIKMNRKSEPKNIFDDDFLSSKDAALEPIDYFLDSDNQIDKLEKERHLSLKTKIRYKKDKKSSRSRKSQNSQQSQKSTSNTKNTKEKSKKKSIKSIKESQLYNSNIVIVHNVDEDDCSSTDPLEKELEKLNKLMSKSKEKKKKKAKAKNSYSK